MTIQQLKVFLAVSRELNYSHAAEQVYMSRQAVRQNIAELERELNGMLFENRGNRLFLTAKGELLRSRALPVMEAFQALQQAMNADIRLDRPLRIGISLAAVPDYLPMLQGLLDSFVQSYPNLPLETVRIENDEVGPALLADVLDAGIVLDLCGKRDGLERSVLSSHPSAVMLNRAHPLFNRAEIALPELDGAVLYLPGMGEEFEPLFRAAKQAGAEPDFTVLHSFYQVLYHVRDLGGTALNRYVPGEDIDPSLIRTIPLHGLPPLCSSFLTREGEASPPLHLLRDWLTAKLREDFAR